MKKRLLSTLLALCMMLVLLPGTAFAEQGGTIDDNTMTFPVWWSGQAVARDAGRPWPHSFRHNVTAEENL